METRYQVFVSSTFTDLKEERKGIMECLLNAKHIPAGMEMFSASNDEQFKYIKKIIDNCDYYILIVGGRYGAINPDSGISFTEQEYDYAVSLNVPILVFLHNNPDCLPPEKQDVENKDKLERFRYKVSQGRLCKMWNDKSDLIASVIISLSEVISEIPQPGWTRGSSFDSTELLSQINELRLEKESNVKEILRLSMQIKEQEEKVDNLASGEDTFVVTGLNSNNTKINITLSWDQIFSAVGPYLYQYRAYVDFTENLKTGINAAYNFRLYVINDNCVQTIKIQFEALGLISITTSKSITNGVSGGVIEFIGLTDNGRKYLSQIKSIKKNS